MADKTPKKAGELTKVEEFYVTNNLNKTDKELAKEIGKPVAAVRECIHRVKGGNSRINKLLVREKGCVVMTEGASAASDESRKSYVSESAIQAAVAREDFEEAARLQRMLKEQRQQTDDAATSRNASYIHRINPNR
jgi:hypothetical protein